MHNIQYKILNIVYRICSAVIETLNSICKKNNFSRPVCVPYKESYVKDKLSNVSNGAHFTKLFAHVDLRHPLRWENFDWNEFRMISWTQDPSIRFDLRIRWPFRGRLDFLFVGYWLSFGVSKDLKRSWIFTHLYTSHLSPNLNSSLNCQISEKIIIE